MGNQSRVILGETELYNKLIGQIDFLNPDKNYFLDIPVPGWGRVTLSDRLTLRVVPDGSEPLLVEVRDDLFAVSPFLTYAINACPPLALFANYEGRGVHRCDLASGQVEEIFTFDNREQEDRGLLFLSWLELESMILIRYEAGIVSLNDLFEVLWHHEDRRFLGSSLEAVTNESIEFANYEGYRWKYNLRTGVESDAQANTA